MSINISQKPEMNVVNVGDELTQEIIDALNAAAGPTAVNPILTDSDRPFATEEEAIDGTSFTSIMNPSAVSSVSFLRQFDEYDLTAFGWTPGTSVMTVLQAANYKNLNHNASTAVGNAMLACQNIIKKGQGVTEGIDWTKRITYSFSIARSANPSTGCVFRACLGKTQAGGGVGDLLGHGIGVRINGSGVLELLAHNGTALTVLATSYTPGLVGFNVRLVSQGGTVTCFVNDEQVGQTTGGPTTLAGTYLYNATIEVQQASIVATTAIYSINQIRLSLGQR